MTKREKYMIIHLLMIVLIIIWVCIIQSIVGVDVFNGQYGKLTNIGLGIICTTASIHGSYLIITSK